MTAKRVKFSTTADMDFVNTLRERVAEYFDSREMSRYGNANMVFKTITLLTMYLLPYGLMLTGVVVHPALLFVLWVFMAFGMAGIGMSIMHDANHGSYSPSAKVNQYVGYLINIVGGSSYVWKIQHNVLHHSFTNIHGHDGDIDTGGILRLSPSTRRRFYHGAQHIYAWFLYGFMTLNWATVKDFKQFLEFRAKGLTAKGKGRFVWQFSRLTMAKLVYYTMMLVLPMLLSPVAWWVTLLFFLSMHFIAGVILSSIFQSAHVMPQVEFPTAPESGRMETNWFVHQLQTTCNFSPRSRVFSWFVGGLNYQIEHHLFPNVSHVHYRHLSRIVRQTAEEYGIPYHVHGNFISALWNHGKALYHFGRPLQPVHVRA
jgi:linoleoyl-CoA desaturase